MAGFDINKYVKELEAPEMPPSEKKFSDFQLKYLQELDASRPKDETAAVSEAPPPGWSTWQNFLDAALLGYHLPAQAMMSATGEEGDRQSTRVARLEEQKRLWEQNNPLPAIATDVAGGLVPSLAASALMQNYVANPLLARMGTLAPRLAQAFPRLARLGGEATSGALQGLGTGAVEAARRGEEDPLEAAKRSIEIGAVANPLMRSATRAFGLASHITPETARYGRALQDAGVPVRSAELPGASPGLRLLDRLFSRGQDAALREKAYERATELAGARSKSIDQAWLDANMGFKDASGVLQPGRIGRGMQEIIDNYEFNASPQFVQNVLTPLAQKAAAHGVDVERAFAPTLLAVAKDIGNVGVGNNIEGKLYHQWVKQGGSLDAALRSKDSTVRGLARELKDSLESHWKSGLPPEAAQQWTDLRRQYRVGKVLEDWFKRNPQGVAAGELDPRLLATSVKSRKAGDMQELRDLAYGMQMLPKAGEHGGHIRYPYLTRMAATPLGLAGVGLLGIEAAPYLREPIHGALHSIWQDPIGAGVPLSVLAATAALGGKGASSLMNSPRAAARYIAAAERGVPVSHFGGANPLVPLAAHMAPYLQEPRTKITVNPEEGLR